MITFRSGALMRSFAVELARHGARVVMVGRDPGRTEAAVAGVMERTALILVGRAIGAQEFDESRLYAGDYDRRFRPVGIDPCFPEGA